MDSELHAYASVRFSEGRLARPEGGAWTDEPHVVVWREYARQAQARGVWPVLSERLPQLWFPIQTGVSQTTAYRAATRQGAAVRGTDGATGLALRRPDELRLLIHPTVAGSIPVLIAADRADFVALVQAFTRQNEPEFVPDSMGACLVSGYNNWDRIHAYRRQWAEAIADGRADVEWPAEWKRLQSQKHIYQDRFIILSDGPYSGVPAAVMGLSETEWNHLSLVIRLEHECAHYFTKRVFGVIRHHVYDEILADYAGLVAAEGHFRADRFLLFMGLEAFPAYRQGGRLQNYRGPLSDEAFVALQSLVRAAAVNLARFDEECGRRLHREGQKALVWSAIASLTLAELASEEAMGLLGQALEGKELRELKELTLVPSVPVVPIGS
ncbi:MAG: hypothetical protein AB1791_06265 [Chloroflexota bacterium]